MHELQPGVFYDLSHVTKVSMYETMGCYVGDPQDAPLYYGVEITGTDGMVSFYRFEEKPQAVDRLKELLQMIEEAKQ